MNYLLDTCVLSELTQKSPHTQLLDWLEHTSESSLFISVITLGEIQQGISQLNKTVKQQQLQKWLQEDLMQRFEGRIIALTTSTLLRWGQLCGEARKNGKTLPVMDALLAASAIEFQLQLVTRNVKDFKYMKLSLYNPWSS